MIESLEKNRINEIMSFVSGMSFDSVLDVGCGTGVLSFEFSKISKIVYGIDKNENEISDAKERYKEVGNLNFTVVNLENHGFKGIFDVVIFSDVIYYLGVDAQKRVMENIYSVLKEDGFFITSRHMGRDDEEINEYSNLFEKIKTKWVTYVNDDGKGWWVSLWKKKKNDLIVKRNDFEIQEEINKILNSKEVNFIALGGLYWCLNKNVMTIIKTINDYMCSFDSNKSMDLVLAVLWCLKLENNKRLWTEFQDKYHSWHDRCVETDFRLPSILGWIGKGKKILDLGVHNGLFTNEYIKAGNDVIGVDLPRVVERFKDEYKFPIIIHDVSEGLSPFKNEEFEVVITGELIEHILEPELLFKEIYRVLKKEGMFIVSCPYMDLGSHDPLHCHKIDKQFFEEKFNGLFKIVDVKEELIKEKGSLIFKAVKI
ncbi:MAG: methyltransferase domain-containing protein [archaeon]|nr:methyltransferase domain-containing protein [archaeon]